MMVMITVAMMMVMITVTMMMVTDHGGDDYGDDHRGFMMMVDNYNQASPAPIQSMSRWKSPSAPSAQSSRPVMCPR